MSSSPGAPPESVYFNHETKFQYENCEILPILVESYMMTMTVDEVKNGLLQLELLHYVKEPAKNLEMYLELPAEEVGEGGRIVHMEGGKNFKDYRQDISRCLMIRMSKNPPQAPRSAILCNLK